MLRGYDEHRPCAVVREKVAEWLVPIAPCLCANIFINQMNKIR